MTLHMAQYQGQDLAWVLITDCKLVLVVPKNCIAVYTVVQCVVCCVYCWPLSIFII